MDTTLRLVLHSAKSRSYLRYMHNTTLTLAEQATNFQTMRHIERVRNLLNKVIYLLLNRGENHDQSKLEPPEVGPLTANTPDLPESRYGSKEYEATKADPTKLGPALAHHYSKNRHHPQHHKRGVDDMNLIDIVEMFVDWKAASERHVTGNIKKSIDFNAEQYNIEPQLRRILENTIECLE